MIKFLIIIKTIKLNSNLVIKNLQDITLFEPNSAVIVTH